MKRKRLSLISSIGSRVKLKSAAYCVAIFIFLGMIGGGTYLLAQTNPYPPGDGTYYYWSSSYDFSLGVPGTPATVTYNVSLTWMTDYNNNPVSGAGTYVTTLNGSTVDQGYMQNNQIMTNNQILLSEWVVFQGAPYAGPIWGME